MSFVKRISANVIFQSNLHYFLKRNSDSAEFPSDAKMSKAFRRNSYGHKQNP